MMIVISLLGFLHHAMVALRIADPSWDECERTLAWVKSRDLPPGTAGRVALPLRLAGLSSVGTVDAVRTADGRTCVLLKSSIGWKENFTGTLCCDSPLRPEEIIERPNFPAYISLVGFPGFEELFLTEKRSDAWFRVHFDL